MADEKRSKSVRCLIVESNQSLQCLVHSWLTAQELSHVQVLNGEMAVSACQQYTFDTIFLDLDSSWPSPVANAIDIIRHIRAHGLNARTPIVGWTGQEPYPQIVKDNTKLFASILTKPFNKEDVLMALTHCRTVPVVAFSSSFVTPQLDLSSLPSEFPVIPLPPKTARVLVVEDCTGTQKIIHGLLRKLTDNVMQAFDGDQAVMLCSQWHYDIIFMDIHMPTVNGLFATKLIRNSAGGLNIYTPIIAFTSSGSLADFAAYGVNDLLAKPFTTESLRDMFDKWTPFSKKTDGVLAATLLDHPPVGALSLAPLSPLFESQNVSLVHSLAPNGTTPGRTDLKPQLSLPTPTLSTQTLGPAAAPGAGNKDTKPAPATSGGPWPRRKKPNPVGHTVKEKQRRASIVHSCNGFRALVPNTLEDDKATVFRKAVDYLTFLRTNIPAEELARLDAAYHNANRGGQSQAAAQTTEDEL